MKTALTLWALAATILAIFGWTREPEPTRIAARRSTAPRAPRLERRVKELEAALAVSLHSESAPKRAPKNAGILALLAEAKALGEGNWNQKADMRIRRDIMRLLMADANAHGDLITVLENDPERAGDVAAYLQSSFAQLVRNTTVTAKVRDTARRLMVEGTTTEQRDAAARILMTYAPPTRDDVLTALERLNTEPDAGVRETLLEVLSDHGRGVGLTVREAAPLMQQLRNELRSGNTWSATALAYWSGDDADFDLVKAGFLDAKDPGTRLSLLNAFQADTRMAGTRGRTFLLEILGDPSYDERVRALALRFLKHYTPWDRRVAEAVRRATR